MSTTNPKITVLTDTSDTFLDLPPPPSLPPWKRTSDPNSSTPEIFTRINTFLPQLLAANAQLESEIAQGRISERRIEDVGENEEQYIEMNLGLGVLEEKKKRAPKARKRRRTGAEVLMKQVELGEAGSMDSDDDGDDYDDDYDEQEEEDKTGDSDSNGEEEDSSDSDEEGSDEDSAEEEEEEDDSDSDCDSSTSTSHTDSNAHYPQQQGEQDNESARIDALLSVLGAESTESPQLLDRKRKRRHEERKVAQRDILAALLNIDAPPSSAGSGGDGGGRAKRKPAIEVVEVEGKE